MADADLTRAALAITAGGGERLTIFRAP